ncbi:hypothetical protein [Streptomyces parvulus]|uniref:hypothetical protein n=1 Tax=Streptomyces parvulus TaxID=146923 RepID=UPI0037D45F08
MAKVEPSRDELLRGRGPRLIAALSVAIVAAAFAVGASSGIVALLDTTPEQPNVPLITYRTASPSP